MPAYADRRARPSAAHVAAIRADIAQRRLSGTYWDAEADRLSASLALLAGDLIAAEQLTQAAHATLDRLGDRDAGYVLAAHLLPLRLLQDRGEEVAPMIAESHRQSPMEPLWRAAVLVLDVRGGEPDRGAASLAALATDGFAAVARNHEWLGAITLAADAAASVGDPQSMAVLAAQLAPFAERTAMYLYGSVPVDLVGRAVGVLEHRLGRSDDAVATLERASARALHIGSPVLSARTQCDLGAVLLDRGQPRDEQRAHRVLEQARATAGQLGLAHVEAHAGALLVPRPAV